MTLLLDTECWLWLGLKPERFSASIRLLIEAADTELRLSAASVWEIAVKHAKGKLPMPVAPSEYIQTRLARTRTMPLPITHVHALRSAELPPHHHDPFDRLLVAQAQIEGLRLVTADPQLRRYDVEILEA